MAVDVPLVYASSDFVAQIFVYGDSVQSSLVAIVVPDVDRVKRWASDTGAAGSTLEEWVQNPELKKAILDDMNKVAKREGVRCLEPKSAVHRPYRYAFLTAHVS